MPYDKHMIQTSVSRNADPTVLGTKLRRARNRASLSVAAAAKASGLSTGFISLLENGKTDATVGRLAKLLDVYGMTITEAFGADGATNGSDEAFNTGQPKALPLASEYISHQEQLHYRFYDSDGSNITPVHVLIDPSGGWFESSRHNGQEVIFVIRGQVELSLENDSVILNAGDRFTIPAKAAHSFRTLSTDAAELFVLLSD